MCLWSRAENSIKEDEIESFAQLDIALDESEDASTSDSVKKTPVKIVKIQNVQKSPGQKIKETRQVKFWKLYLVLLLNNE